MYLTELRFAQVFLVSKGLFTWREGALANQVTRLGGLKHIPPLHATHLGGIGSGLFLDRP